MDVAEFLVSWIVGFYDEWIYLGNSVFGTAIPLLLFHRRINWSLKRLICKIEGRGHSPLALNGNFKMRLPTT